MDFTTIDWSWLAKINLLQVAIVVIAIWIVFRLLVKFWPWLHKLMDLTTALDKLPPFMTNTTAALAEQAATLAAQNEKIAEIHHEVNYNNGSSVKDAVDRVELGVRGLYDRVDSIDETLTADHVAADETQERIEAIEKTIPRDQLGRFTKKEITQ